MSLIGNELEGLDLRDEGRQAVLELFEDLLFAEMLDGVMAGGSAEGGAESGVGDEAGGGGVEGCFFLCRDDKAAGGMGDKTLA